MIYQRLIKPFLFRMDAEKAHYFVFDWIKRLLSFAPIKKLCRSLYRFEDARLEREVFGIKFPNPIGLAAGFDKDAALYDELSAFGFGFIEVGTVTPKAQEGNPKPRLFRLPGDEALINRMGFNNGGVEQMVQRLKKRNKKLIIGGNIGKNKLTPNEEAINDYLICFRELFDYVDYFVVNVSSPNTPNLRELQEKEPLLKLLTALQVENKLKVNPKPILLKIAPDLSNSQLDDIVDIMAETKLAGLIASNTTISRSGLSTSPERLEEIGNGGLSGKPVRNRSTEVISYLAQKSNKAFPIIGVGGIFNAQDAREKLEAGASLVQVYTGFIYEGPGMVSRMNRELLKFQKQ